MKDFLKEIGVGILCGVSLVLVLWLVYPGPNANTVDDLSWSAVPE
jgi:hypothetical protein